MNDLLPELQSYHRGYETGLGVAARVIGDVLRDSRVYKLNLENEDDRAQLLQLLIQGMLHIVIDGIGK